MGFVKRFFELNGPWLARELRRAASQVEHLLPGPPQLGIILFHHNEGVTMASIEVRDTSAPLNATVSFVDAKGNPTTADDVPRWTSDNEDAATVAASDDGLSAVVTIGNPGAAVITVDSTDSDGTDVSAQGTVTVIAGEAAVGSVDFTPGA